MSLALHSFLVNSLRVDSVDATIVVDRATTEANVKSILCSALETISKTKARCDAAPHSPKRAPSSRKFRLPGSPHISKFQQSSKHSSSPPTTKPPVPPCKPPSRWMICETEQDKNRSPPPRLPRRVLSTQTMVMSQPVSCNSKAAAPPQRQPSIIESIAALPFDECGDPAAGDEEAKSSSSLSPSPVCVRDFCISRREQLIENDYLFMLGSSLDDLTIFED